MYEQRSNGHSVSRLAAHIVWSTKYRYHVLRRNIQTRCRTLLIQMVLKGRSSRKLQQEFLEIK